MVCALRSEARCLGRTFATDASSPERLADGTLLAVTGMGPAAAAAGARRLCQAGAQGLLSWGMAGGLDPALRPGTLLLPVAVLTTEGSEFATTPQWRAQL